MEAWGQTTNGYENPVCAILESAQKEAGGSDGVWDETENRILKTQVRNHWKSW